MTQHLGADLNDVKFVLLCSQDPETFHDIRKNSNNCLCNFFFLKKERKRKEKNDQHCISNSSYKECDKSAHRHDARLWKCHTLTHTSWILTDEILTWPKCILWHGWCTFHLTADKAESLAQVSVNKPTNACTACMWVKKWKIGKVHLLYPVIHW